MIKHKILIVALILVPLILCGSVSAAPNSASLKLFPFEGELVLGTEYGIEVRVFTEGNNVDAADVDLTFTPSMGTVRDGESSKAGINLEEGSAFTSFIANSIASSTATVTAYRTDTPLDTGETGYSVLGTFYFTPTVLGTFHMTFAFTPDLTTDSNVVQSVTSNDILTSVRNASFTIVETSSVAPTITLTPTATPTPTTTGAGPTSTGSTATPTPTPLASQIQQNQPIVAQEDLPIGQESGDIPLIVEKEEYRSPYFFEETDRVLEASRLTLVGSIMSYALLYGFKDFILIFYRVAIAILRFLRIYHNPKRWGIVYDSRSKLPLSNVLLKLIHLDTQKVQYAVSDVDGRFGFVTGEGKYRIECQKRSYLFPTAHLAGHTKDHQYHDLYHGGEILLHQESVITMDIPLDPIGHAGSKHSLVSYILHEYVRPHSMKILYGLSVLVSGYIAVMTRSPFDIILFIILLLFIFDSVFIRGVITRGKVISHVTRHRQPGVKVTLSKKGKIEYLFYTDEHGEYFLVCQNGTYEIQMESHGHIRYSDKVHVSHGFLNSEIEI